MAYYIGLQFVRRDVAMDTKRADVSISEARRENGLRAVQYVQLFGGAPHHHLETQGDFDTSDYRFRGSDRRYSSEYAAATMVR